MKHRVLVLVLDGVGCGAMSDAAEYGDVGANTLHNLSVAVGGLSLPNLARLGLGNVVSIQGVRPDESPQACYGRMAEASAGKDSTTGHWELAGLVTERPFPVFPRGFPEELIRSFERAIGRKVIGNVAESGTEIIKRLGEEHIRTGSPIVYTSADSVFQVACHEDVVPGKELYRICVVAREMLDGPYRVSRVIARPFAGAPGAFKRTSRRRDFSCLPHGPTLLDLVKAAGLAVVTIGKVDDLFAGRGLTETHHSVNNDECVDATLRVLERAESGLVFTNLIQFDMDWGHRNDTAGFARGLEEFDRRVPEILSCLSEGDVFLITADHGTDPTLASTDHSREYVPLLAYGPGLRNGVNLGTRPTFADLGQTAAEFLSVGPTLQGTSFLSQIR